MKKEIEQIVKSRLENYESHQSIFDDLKHQYNRNGKELTAALCKYPIESRKKQYKWVWIILLVSLITLLLFRVSSLIINELDGLEKFVSIAYIIILGLIIFSVLKYEKYTFQFLGVLGIANLLRIYFLKPEIYVSSDSIFHFQGIVNVILILVVCITSYFVYYKLFVKHKVEKVKTPNMDGTTRLEIQAQFTER